MRGEAVIPGTEDAPRTGGGQGIPLRQLCLDRLHYDAEGLPTRLVGAICDMTEQRELQARQRHERALQEEKWKSDERALRDVLANPGYPSCG